MVKLTGPSEQAGRAVGERGSARPGPRRRPQGSLFGRRREEMRDQEPTTLLQLEELARRAVQLMEKHEFNPKSESNYVVAMDLLRCQYNLVSDL